jgi:hypothetical protein
MGWGYTGNVTVKRQRRSQFFPLPPAQLTFSFLLFHFFFPLPYLIQFAIGTRRENAADGEPDELVQQARHYFCRDWRHCKFDTLVFTFNYTSISVVSATCLL